MANLVGDSTTQAGTYQSSNSQEVYFACGGFVASATGTATEAYIRISNLNLTTAVKVLAYSAAGSLLATATISSPATGWNHAALSSSVAVSSGTTYILGFIAYPNTAYLDIYQDGTSWNIATDQTGDYTTPPASITPRDDGSGDYGTGKPSVYLDGTTGGGGATLASRLSLLGVGV